MTHPMEFLMIGITCFVIILLSWFGGVRYGKIPAGSVAIAAGSLIAWGSTALGLNFGGMTTVALAASVAIVGFQQNRVRGESHVRPRSTGPSVAR